MIKKMLLALDGSERANHALDLALELAEKHSANILLLSVYHLSAAVYYLLRPPPEVM